MRNLALFLILSAAAAAQTSTQVQKPARTTSASTAGKATPSAQPAKPSPVTGKASTAPTQTPVVSVTPVTSKTTSAPVSGAGQATKPVSAAATSVKPQVLMVPKGASPAGRGISAKAIATAKLGVLPAKAKPVAATSVPVRGVVVSTKSVAAAQSKTQTAAVEEAKPQVQAEEKKAPKVISSVGRRDPFVSPVVNLGAIGSGCASGKRCLAIDQIALRGVVRSENGMIAVVVNAMDKAYFLRENDPVFNGYVLKITGDSIVFKETFHDRLGKPLTRDVTKSITRPAV